MEAKDPQVMILYQFYTIPQMNGPQIFVLQKKLGTYTMIINSSAHEFLIPHYLVEQWSAPFTLWGKSIVPSIKYCYFYKYQLF